MRQVISKDEACGHLCNDAGFFSELRRTVALAFLDGSNRRIVGVDDFTVIQLLAIDQLSRLFFDMSMGFQCLVKFMHQPFLLGLFYGGVFL